MAPCEDEPDLLDLASALFMSMNGPNGIELAEYTPENCHGIKIMLASGYPQPALKLEQHKLGEFTFVSKPYRLSDLARSLRSVQ